MDGWPRYVRRLLLRVDSYLLLRNLLDVVASRTFQANQPWELLAMLVI